jgi:hypothetical protein
MKPDTLQILRDFQKWRLGETDEMPGDDATYPKQLTGALDDAIAELEKGTWQPIANAPKDNTPVDLWSPSHERLTNYRRVERTKTNVFYDPICSGVVCVRDATHFMFIPDVSNL